MHYHQSLWQRILSRVLGPSPAQQQWMALQAESEAIQRDTVAYIAALTKALNDDDIRPRTPDAHS